MKRIQRQRKRGWKMPDNTVYVGRPTKWGNPFIPTDNTDRAREKSVSLYRDYITAKAPDLTELRGKNLSCWCNPGQPCHADVLLELANNPLN